LSFSCHYIVLYKGSYFPPLLSFLSFSPASFFLFCHSLFLHVLNVYLCSFLYLLVFFIFRSFSSFFHSCTITSYFSLLIVLVTLYFSLSLYLSLYMMAYLSRGCFLLIFFANIFFLSFYHSIFLRILNISLCSFFYLLVFILHSFASSFFISIIFFLSVNLSLCRFLFLSVFALFCHNFLSITLSFSLSLPLSLSARLCHSFL
jgi:hypothetical protein